MHTKIMLESLSTNRDDKQPKSDAVTGAAISMNDVGGFETKCLLKTLPIWRKNYIDRKIYFLFGL